jgi:hypothetical protein
MAIPGECGFVIYRDDELIEIGIGLRWLSCRPRQMVAAAGPANALSFLSHLLTEHR